MSHRMKHYPAQLSGGQQQRVAVARAVVGRPSILLADEPTGNLDSRTSREVMELFQKLNDEGITIIIVTHDQDVARHARRAVVVRDGEVVADSTDFDSATRSLHDDEAGSSVTTCLSE